jgi:hypothetical protein
LWTTTCPISGSSLSLTHCWPSCLSSLCLLWRSATCPSLFSCALSATPFLCCVLVFSSLFIVHFLFFAWEGVSLPRGLCWLILGVAGRKLCDAWCSPVFLLKNSHQVWRHLLVAWQPSCLLSVTWYREAFHF